MVTKKTAKTPPTTDPEAEKGLRVKQFRAANVKRLELVEFTTDGKGGLVILGGDNGAGKTSVIDSLIWLLGGKRAVPKGTKVVREGEVEGSAHVDLGELIIDRVWSADGRDTCTIRTRDGHALKDTEAVFATLGGALCFDPLALLSMKPADRRTTLLGLIELPFNLDDKNAEYDKLFGHRTDVNRQLKSAKAVVENAESDIGGVDMDGPDLETALAARATGSQWVDKYEALTRERSNTAARRDQQADAVRRAREELKAQEERLTFLERQHDEAATAFSEWDETGKPDFEAIDAAISNARLRQQQSAAIAERDRMSEQAVALADESKQLTAALDAIIDEKAAALRDAKMPVVGLGFDDSDVTYNDLPFAQASGAEQLRVAIAIAMAKNPTARIIMSKDGSLLDKHNLALLDEMTKGKGYQLFIEVVHSTDGEYPGIIIEAGRVKSETGGGKETVRRA